jgi:3-hydroxymyristoyl/3-hydroxydecanoyl-(acyl carrier protein) dehydratase
MDGHFRAFSFVDRLTLVEPGQRVRGCYAIPAELSAFPISLVSEAVGQLAAWAAMAAVGFSHRPVAGLAGQVELLSQPQPGQTLELAADMESVDTEVAGYSGLASVNGVPVVRLRDCVGPMVPMEDFDDPRLVRERFDLLCETGATPGGFHGLPPLALNTFVESPGQSATASLTVPTAAPFFADHFPRRHVFPGTLLMHANLETARWLARRLNLPRPGAAWQLRRVSDVKLRTFIPPGEKLFLEARVTARSEAALELAIETRNSRALLGSAEVHFAAASQP